MRSSPAGFHAVLLRPTHPVMLPTSRPHDIRSTARSRGLHAGQLTAPSGVSLEWHARRSSKGDEGSMRPDAHSTEGLPDDLGLKLQRPFVDIAQIQGHGFLPAQVTATTDLP